MKSNQKNIKRNKMRPAFSLIDMALALVIMSVLTIGATYALRDSKENLRQAQELDFYYIFEAAVKSSFEQIIDTFEPVCSQITSDSQTDWGWGHSSCSNTSPLPEYIDNKIRYNLNLSNLSASIKSSLINAIIDAYAPYCTKDSETSTTLDLFCPNVINLEYEINGVTDSTAHTLGKDIDPRYPPSFILTYKRVSKIGNVVENATFRATLANLWQKRRNFTLEKLNDIRRVLKQFYQTRMSLEIANSPDAGLNSTDDEFVPWYWEVFGDNSNPSDYPVCDLSGGTSCSNLTSPDYWRTDTPTKALLMRKLILNMMNSDWKYTIDGFGNKINLYPILTDCSDNDINSCTITSPDVPQENYFSIKKPPYTSVLYLDICSDKTITVPDYCRLYIAY